MTDTPETADQTTPAAATGAADVPPDRLAISPRSPFFDGDLLARGIGIRFKGKERTDVEEYSISEGWIRVAAGKSKDRFGQPMTIKLSGEVEAWFEDAAAAGEGEAAKDADGGDKSDQA